MHRLDQSVAFIAALLAGLLFSACTAPAIPPPTATPTQTLPPTSPTAVPTQTPLPPPPTTAPTETPEPPTPTAEPTATAVPAGDASSQRSDSDHWQLVTDAGLTRALPRGTIAGHERPSLALHPGRTPPALRS
ncbi:MAG: hypothetical protein ACE5HA_17090 [Anaerolineae bacterium]